MATALSVVLDDRVRILLNDPETPTDGSDPSWATANLVTFWNDYVRELFKRRPDAQLSSTGTVITYTEATSKTSNIIVEDRWIEPGTHYICAMAFMSDAGDRRDEARSERHWARFLETVAL